MDGAFFGFDEASAQRIAAATEAVEQQNPHRNMHPPRYGVDRRGLPPEVQLVRITNATQGVYGYPGKIQILSTPVANPPSFTDGGDCWVLDPNAATLLTKLYVARRTAVNANDPQLLPIFMVAGATTEPDGWTGTFTAALVTAVSCNAGTLSVTTKTLTITASKGDITTAPTLT